VLPQDAIRRNCNGQGLATRWKNNESKYQDMDMAGIAQEKTAFLTDSNQRQTRFSAEFSARATGLEPATTGSTVATNLGPESLKNP
jgi:hypothetical protein